LQNDLIKHINLKHDNHYEYQCNECDFKAKELNSIKRHMLKFHLSNGENAFNTSDGQHFSCSYMCHVCNKVYCQGSTLSQHLKKRHNFEWPSGHSRFKYKLENDGYYRLQTLRYESVELVEQLNKDAIEKTHHHHHHHHQQQQQQQQQLQQQQQQQQQEQAITSAAEAEFAPLFAAFDTTSNLFSMNDCCLLSLPTTAASTTAASNNNHHNINTNQEQQKQHHHHHHHHNLYENNF
jgi:hypothetical protein